MTAAVHQQASDVDRGEGGAPARRAVLRWACRLFRREWRQQLLVLALLTVAVAATVLGAAVATNTPSSPNAATFGTADHLVNLPGKDPRLDADLAALGQRFGPVQVIENQRLNTGTTQDVQLRAQDPAGPYGRPMLDLVSGRYPTGPAEVAVTAPVAEIYNLHVGGVWHQGGLDRQVVGLVENPNNLLDAFALLAPGQLGGPPDRVTVLFDADPADLAGYAFPAGVTPQTPAPPSAGFPPEVVVLAAAIFGLIFIGLVATAGFTVLAQRRLRSLGMLSALGATHRHVRLVMVANGAVVGATAALVGAVIGLAAWFGYAPRLQTSTGHRIAPLHVPWWLIITGMLLAVLTAVVAARRPARDAARLPVVAALSGQPAPPKAARRLAVPGIVLLVVGPVLLATSGGWGSSGEFKALGGLAATILGLLFVAPACLAILALAGRHAPVAVRLALRDLARYRARSGSALAAICFAVLMAVFISIVATARYADPIDYFGPNLPANQLIVYAPGVKQQGPMELPPLQEQDRPKDLHPTADAIADALDSTQRLELDTAAGGDVVLVEEVGTSGAVAHGFKSYGGLVYLATPEILAHYGIAANQVDPNADLLTSRSGLGQMNNLALMGMKRGEPPPGCVPGRCIDKPRIQTLRQLPTDISAPNLLVTEQGLRQLGLGWQRSPAGWLVQAAEPLSSAQINTARQLTLAAGGTIETRSQNPSLDELRNGVTAGGILIALGVLAMTVGLVRSEAADELRTLTATGASRRIRRTLTSATAGSLGLLGAVLGTAAAYFAAICYYRSSLSTTVAYVPVADLIAVLIGLPLVAALGGWLFAGREPQAIARNPLG
jgi:putative ABC transport system permease protein